MTLSLLPAVPSPHLNEKLTTDNGQCKSSIVHFQFESCAGQVEHSPLLRGPSPRRILASPSRGPRSGLLDPREQQGLHRHLFDGLVGHIHGRPPAPGEELPCVL